MKVAVVWNHDRSGVISRFGRICPERYGASAIRNVVEALAAGAHDVMVCEGDKGLLESLGRFMPPDPQGRPSGVVFNMAYGIQGECRYTHVPAMLEMAGIPYTGSDPLGHALALDKVVTKRLMRDLGIPTPEFRVMRSGSEEIGGLRFPLVVKPRHESTSFGLQLVHELGQLGEAVERIVAKYQQDALVEEYIEGREICVGLLGNRQIEILPLVEHDFGERETHLITWEDKMHRSAAEPSKVCPAPADEVLTRRVREISVATFRACGCKDFARVDLRIDANGNPYVLEINSMAALGVGASFVMAARTAGYDFPGLVGRILDVTCERYGLAPVIAEAAVARRPRRVRRLTQLAPSATETEQPHANTRQ